MLFVESVVAGSLVNPPGRISGVLVLANARFDVMQVSRVNAAQTREVQERAQQRRRDSSSSSKRPRGSFSPQRAVKADGAVLRLCSLGNVPDVNAHLSLA